MTNINKQRLIVLKEYLYEEILENYGWLPPEDDYTDETKIEYYKENFIKQFKYNFMENINESIDELNERQKIIDKVVLL